MKIKRSLTVEPEVQKYVHKMMADAAGKGKPISFSQGIHILVVAGMKAKGSKKSSPSTSKK